MIELHYWPTPNGHKIALFLEEAGLEYKVVPVNIGKGDQFTPEFLKISPNNGIPAIIGRCPPIRARRSPSSIRRHPSAYLADKTGKFAPEPAARRLTRQRWLFWQVHS